MGDKGTSATLMTDAESDSSAPRIVFKEAIDMARLAFKDEDGLAVAGFFEADETGSVKNREEGSAYQVFRDSTTKNAKLPFGKSTSKDLARVFGVKKMNTMWLLKKNAIRGTTLGFESANSSMTFRSTFPMTPITLSAPGRRKTASASGALSAHSST